MNDEEDWYEDEQETIDFQDATLEGEETEEDLIKTFSQDDILAYTDFYGQQEKPLEEEVEVEEEGDDSFYLTPEQIAKLNGEEEEKEPQQQQVVVSTEQMLYEETDEELAKAPLTDNFVEGDAVRKYTILNSLDYPHIQLVCQDIKAYHAQMFEDLIPKDEYNLIENAYTIYVNMNGGIVKVGKLENKAIRTLFSPAFSHFEKVGYLDQATEIAGEMLLALCPPTM